MRDTKDSLILRPKLIAVSVAACFAISTVQVNANPTGPTVAAGSATFSAAGNALTVTNSANTVINWQGFSIGINEITKFVQPNQASAVLNRVVGVNGVIPQSVIDGILSSNGRVFLLNPMGIVFGAGARIDVAGMVASSLNLSDQDFLNGKLRFTEVPGAAGVVNHGIIETTSGGRVFLIGPSVENTGVIRSPQGEIVLAAGKQVELVSEGSPFISVRLTATTEQAVNVGSLISDSGRIGVYGALVRNSGVAEANGATVGAGGQIRFVATKDLTNDVGSRVAANGTSGGKILLQAEDGTNLMAGTVEATGSSGKGGEVQALGVRVGLIGHGVIDASGETGGGTVLVGGDYQGANADVQNAQRTLIGADGVIRANARTSGDGGRVIVWADGDTRFFGSISARGGSQSGNGGFVETSGKHGLQALGRVNVGAPKGKGGTWLLDPEDISVIAGAAAAYSTCDSPTFGSICFNDPPDPGTSFVGVDTINATLAYAGSVQVQAKRNISLQTDMMLDVGGTISAYAGNDINFFSHNVGITPTGIANGQSLNLRLQANASPYGSGVGAIKSDPGFGNIATNGGFVELRGAAIGVGNINTTGGPGTGNTYVHLESTNGAVTAGNITTGNTAASSSWVYGGANGGNLSLGNIQTGSSFSDSSVRLYAGNSSQSVSTGSITTGSANSNTGVYIDASGNITVAGSIITGNADGVEGSGYSYVELDSGGATTITGSIMTGNGRSDSGVYINASDSVSIAGSLVTGNSAYGYTYVNIEGHNGSVTTGPITTGNALYESYVEIEAGGSVSTGNILTGSSLYDSGVYIYADTGNIVTGSIATGNSAYGWSAVNLYASEGGISTGDIRLGRGGTGYGGTYRYVFMEAGPGDIVTGHITTRALHPSEAGGDVMLRTGTGRITVNGTIDARGADGINDGTFYYGGSPGGNVGLYRTAAAPMLGTAIEVNGGILTSGGNAITVPNWWGSHGGSGGRVGIGRDGMEGFIFSPVQGGVRVAGSIITNGGDGAGAAPGWGTGGHGGYGGMVRIHTNNLLRIGAPPNVGVETLVINTSGGAGGAGGAAASPAGYGGDGGSAGFIDLFGSKIVVNGLIHAKGGAGGPGGAGAPGIPAGGGGDGGYGGIISLSLNPSQQPGSATIMPVPISSLDAKITELNGIIFVNGGFDFSGGLAGAGLPTGLAGGAGRAMFGGNVTFINLTSPADTSQQTVQAMDKLLDIIDKGLSCKP